MQTIIDLRRELRALQEEIEGASEKTAREINDRCGFLRRKIRRYQQDRRNKGLRTGG